MVSIKPEEMSERENYKFLIGSIIPRPIAVVSTLSETGVVNIAPFSYFNIVTSNPPIVSVSIQRKSGEMKDTTRNLLSQKEGVIHITDESHLVDVNETAANLAENESELLRTQFTLEKADEVRVPMINELKIKMEVELFQHIPIKEDHLVNSDLLLLKVKKYHIEDELYHEGRINPDVLKPVSRLAGNDYATLGEKITIQRPD